VSFATAILSFVSLWWMMDRSSESMMVEAMVYIPFFFFVFGSLGAFIAS
jgi:hypothetical protein